MTGGDSQKKAPDWWLVEVPADEALGAADLLQAAGFSLLETLLLGRVFLVGLLEERNYVLARNIRAASMQVLTPPRAVRQRGRGKDGRAVVAVISKRDPVRRRRLRTAPLTHQAAHLKQMRQNHYLPKRNRP